MSGPPESEVIDLRVAAARRGDRDAVERLLRQEYPKVAGLCRRLCANPEDAADATQEAMIAIVRGLPRFDGRSAFGTWVYRVATNACLDELRRLQRRPVPTLPRDTAIPEADISVRLDIDAALARLPIEFRTAVVLRDLCGLDYAEISAVLDVAAGTVRSRISRGRAALALDLGNQTRPLDVKDGEPDDEPDVETLNERP